MQPGQEGPSLKFNIFIIYRLLVEVNAHNAMTYKPPDGSVDWITTFSRLASFYKIIKFYNLPEIHWAKISD